MPFIKQEIRPLVDRSAVNIKQPGDACYKIYKEMVRRWKAEPRWTTAHEIYRDFCIDPDGNKLLDEIYSQSLTFGFNDACTAAHLAWQVFFQLYVMPYELEKRLENGDVE